MSIDRGMDKEDVVHIYNWILLSHKKEWNNIICSNMDELGDYHTKWTKSDRKTNIIWYHLYEESNFLKRYKWTYLQNRLTDIENKLMVTRGETWGWGINQELGMNIHTLLYIRQITNKNLPSSTGNSTQYSVITYMRKESKKEWIYVYV